MIVKRVLRNEDGSIEATLLLSPEQAAFLINTGLGFLVQSGAATLMDMTLEEYEAQRVANPNLEPLNEPTPADTTVPVEVIDVEAEDKAQKAFLAGCDIKIIGKA